MVPLAFYPLDRVIHALCAFSLVWMNLVVQSILSVCYSTTLLTFTTCFIVPWSSAKSLPLILCQTSLKFKPFFFSGGNFTFVWLGQFLLHKIIITIIIIIIIIIIITLNMLHFLIIILIIIIIKLNMLHFLIIILYYQVITNYYYY